MPLDNFSNLKAEVINFSGRNDIANTLDSIVDIVESRIYANDIAPLRIRLLETRSTASADTASRFLELPEGFLKMRRLNIQTDLGGCDIKYLTPEQMTTRGTIGLPRFFTVTSQLEFDRVPDQTYTVEMQYFKRATPLSDTNPTNVVLTNYPDMYLFGCLWVVNQFAAEEDKAEYFYGKFIEALSGANFQDQRGRYGAAPVMRTERSTP